MTDKQLIFLTTDSKPMTGGIAEYLHQLCEHLGLTLDVELFSTVPTCEELKPIRYKVHQLEKRPARDLGRKPGDSFFPSRKINTWRYYKRLENLAKQEIQKLDPKNKLVVIGYWSLESHFWCRACHQYRIPYAVIYHGAELISRLSWPCSDWRKKDLKYTASAIVNSKGTGQLLQNISPKIKSFHVINPGIDARTYIPSEAQELFQKRSEVGVPPNAFVLLAVGRLIKRKGFDLVMESLAALQEQFPLLYYIITGDGPEKTRLKEKALSLGVSDKVIFLSDVNDKDKWILYAICDVFIMPNRTLNNTDWEGFGIVFLEAALAGKPSIGGKNSGVPDAIVDGETGFLVNSENGEEITSAIRRLFENETERKRKGESARKRALAAFSWNYLADLFKDSVFKNMDERRHRRR